MELTQFDENPQIIKMNRSEGITEVVFSLDELDNTINGCSDKVENDILDGPAFVLLEVGGNGNALTFPTDFSGTKRKQCHTLQLADGIHKFSSSSTPKTIDNYQFNDTADHDSLASHA